MFGVSNQKYDLFIHLTESLIASRDRWDVIKLILLVGFFFSSFWSNQFNTCESQFAHIEHKRHLMRWLDIVRRSHECIPFGRLFSSLSNEWGFHLKHKFEAGEKMGLIFVTQFIVQTLDLPANNVSLSRTMLMYSLHPLLIQTHSAFNHCSYQLQISVLKILERALAGWLFGARVPWKISVGDIFNTMDYVHTHTQIQIQSVHSKQARWGQ